MNATEAPTAGTRERVIAAALQLLSAEGRDAISTRAVSHAAGIQHPTIYRLFGDKKGLLDAIALQGLSLHLDSKRALRETDDPVADLQAGWDQHVTFGLANPALYELVYSQPRPGVPGPAADAAAELLAGYVRRVAQAGRLTVDEQLAAQMIHAAGRGTTLTLLAQHPDQRDLRLSALTRDAVIYAITSDPPAQSHPGPAGAAIALRADLEDVTALTEPERKLLGQWLDQITGRAPRQRGWTTV